jgi:multiple sugar transport system permease protein
MRLVILGLYAALTIGAITMVYPFLMMVATGMTSSVDQEEGRFLVPTYLYRDERLFAKLAEDKFADSPSEINLAYSSNVTNAKDVAPPQPGHSRGLIAAWRRFVEGLGPDDYAIGFRVTVTRPTSLLNEKYQAHVDEKFSGDIRLLNRAFSEENTVFQTIEPPVEQLHRRDFLYRREPKVRDWIDFKQTLPREFRIPIRADRVFQEFLNGEYKGRVDKLNAEWGTDFAHIQEIPFGDRPPASSRGRELWERCLREELPYRYLLVGAPDGSMVRADKDVDLYDPDARNALQERVENASIADLAPDTLEMRFARQAGVTPDSLIGLQAEDDWLHVRENLRALRVEFATRNYRYVLNYILLHGRAVWVTVLFCLAAVVTQLIVNPLCAYALSRYPMRSTARILLFVLATMAFPAEVALIPSFLLLKNLGLLNTIWALILPTVASGFSIFLLKGFFDSLPKELYEAGTIDGAGEMTMFSRVTLPLSKPIFAVIALQAFLGAYGAFMYAFLVCQDQRMWTIMVWLYELHVRSPKFLTMAGLSIAALPSLLVFLLAQNVIMRGIIIPTEK